jgi:hypothetical protein
LKKFNANQPKFLSFSLLIAIEGFTLQFIEKLRGLLGMEVEAGDGWDEELLG